MSEVTLYCSTSSSIRLCWKLETNRRAPQPFGHLQVLYLASDTLPFCGKDPQEGFAEGETGFLLLRDLTGRVPLGPV